MKGKKIAILISCAVFVLIFAFMFVFCTLFPRTEESDYSTLQEFPELTWDSFTSGEFFSEFATWFTDTVCRRDRFIDWNSRIKALYGFEPDEVVISTGSRPPEVSEESEWVPDISWGEVSDVDSAPDTSAGGSDVPDTSVGDESEVSIPVVSKDESKPAGDEEMAGDILILGTRALEIYYGSETNIVKFSQLLNKFADKVGSGVRVYSMVIPKAAGLYLEDSEKYGHLAGRTLRDLNAAKAALNSNVTSVDIYDILYSHRDEQVYFRTDHHWAALGAFYAAQTFAEKAGVEFAPLSSYTKNVRTGYIGTMYKYSNYHPTLLNNPEDFVTYVPKSSYEAVYYNQQMKNGRTHDIFWYIDDDHRSSWYSTYIAGDSYAVQIKSDVCKNGRKLLIVKDSYGNALAPYFIDSFEEVYIVDARTFELQLPEFVKSYGITDVLFAECAFSAVGSGYRNDLEALIG